jgi:hypothetical protein
METQKLRIAKAILSKQYITGGITITNFKIHCSAITIKTAWFWHRNGHEKQRLRKEDPDLNLHIYS